MNVEVGPPRCELLENSESFEMMTKAILRFCPSRPEGHPFDHLRCPAGRVELLPDTAAS
jgi:hypothetical protein